ncbi:MAG: tRNA (adenosine(37)-N6)-dimethylallyltransferase MiaA [Calditrichaceae bacterium]|nr:tRNA (adenosine(37)-N6)-dimethylallyltransferase MiaA [Calditrichaceae bacterium]
MTSNDAQPMATKPPVLVILGPTGSGKTALSEAIAGKIPAEIVSADSRQIYRFMDIGTAKPPAALLRKIPHHFVDILNPDQDFSAGEYARAAREVVEQIFQRKKLPLVVGGSGLYIRALLEGFFKEDVKDPAIRAELERRLEREGIEPLYAELQRVDPAGAEKIHPRNARRVIRFLEVYYASGTPMSQIQQASPDPASFAALKIGLAVERKTLYARLNRRVEEMFEQGLAAEVRGILERGFSPESNALNSVGYKEVIAYLRGEIDLFTCKELVKRNTRRYAKRQMTWFRAEKNVHWIETGGEEGLSAPAERVLAKWLSRELNC